MDTKQLETTLEDVFVKKAPALPTNAKKVIADYLPWINLVLGVFALWSVYNLWHWAHWVDRWNNALNDIYSAYGAPVPVTNRMSVTVWLSLAVLAVEAIIYILAFPSLRARKMAGWRLMFYALLVNVAYGLVIMFTSRGGISDLLGSVIGTAIGLYFLFQIKGEYEGKKAVGKAATAAPKTDNK